MLSNQILFPQVPALKIAFGCCTSKKWSGWDTNIVEHTDGVFVKNELYEKDTNYKYAGLGRESAPGQA